MPHAPSPDDSYVLRIALGPPGNDEIDLRVPPVADPEFRAALDAEEINYGRILEFSAGGGEWQAYSVVAASTSTVIWRLTRALKAFLDRHKERSVKVSLNGKTTEFKGYSEEEVKRLLKAAVEAQVEATEAWERVKQQRKSRP